MMTITPPRSESSPDISPCQTPSNPSTPDKVLVDNHSAAVASSVSGRVQLQHPNHQPGGVIGNNGLPSPVEDPNGIDSQPVVLTGDVNDLSSRKKSIGFEMLDSTGLRFSSDSHLHSLLHGRSIVSFGGGNKNPSPPQDDVPVMPRRNTIPSSNPANINNSSYRNAVTKSSESGDDLASIKENSLHEANFDNVSASFNSFDNQFSNGGWANVFQPMPTGGTRTSAPPVVVANNHQSNIIGQKNGMFGHRNTMPSLNASPFSFDNASFAFNSVNNSTNNNINNNNSGSGTNVTSLDCFLVQFTSGRTDTYYVPQDSSAAMAKIKSGDYVIVEADRGEDLGRVIMDNINVPMPRRNSTTSSAAAMTTSFDTTGLLRLPNDIDEFSMPSNNPTNNMPKKIYRLAQPVEIESLLGKVRDELNAIAVGHYKVQEWKLPMAIIDAEYQWDRRKLTFFFSVTLPSYFPNQPSPRIDFRTLVRDLYQIYRTRIWMYCVDKDKNRSNRSHNRENFLKQLNMDIDKNPKQKQTNSLKAVLEEHHQGYHHYSESRHDDFIMEKEIDLDQLTFGVADMNVNR